MTAIHGKTDNLIVLLANVTRQVTTLILLEVRRYRRPLLTEGYNQMMDTSTWYVLPLQTKTEASMNKNVIYVGLDVDDAHYHGAAFDKHPSLAADKRLRT